MKLCKYISFGAIALLIIYMAAVSVLEKTCGADTVMEWGYRSPAFIALWAVAALSGVPYLYSVMIKGRERKKIPYATAGIHLAFVLILAGALVTHVFGEQGALHLRKGQAPVREYVSEDGSPVPLPFSVSLEDFRVEYYPGSYVASDYVSTLRVETEGTGTVARLSMNRIFRYRGYRFCQAAYDDDGTGSTLAVSHDPAGVAVTYTGYVLLLLSSVGFFFQKDSGFRQILRQVSVRSAAVAVLLLAPGFLSDTFASEKKGAVRDDLKCLPEETAREYGRMYVYYNGRVCPMQTLARDFTLKLYGKPSYEGFSPEQVLTGWIFYHDSWKKTVEDTPAESRKAAIKAQDRENAIMLVRSARLLRIFPYESPDGRVVWYSSVDTLPSDMDNDQWIFVRKVMSLAGECIMKKDYAGAEGIFAKIREFQRKTAADVLPSDSRIAAERVYNSIEHPGAAFVFCLSVGLLLALLFCFRSPGQDREGSGTGSPVRAAGNISFVLSAAVFAWLSVIIILRWYISSHVPMSNGYETMMLLAWHTMMLTVFLRRKFPLIQPLGFLLAGFALLVASLGESDPQITHMVPVLSSPLLSVHVMCMMVSYSLLGLVMLNSLLALVRHYAFRRQAMTGYSASISRLILYPAVFFLAAGTFLGAVWANVSWGRYWAWDPKEVWALITLLVYAFALHGNSLKLFRQPVSCHWFCVLAFLCVVITYFGVNFFLGGLHSYA